MSRRPLKVIQSVYGIVERSARRSADKHGFPCVTGCAWCCYIPVRVTAADVELLRRALPSLSNEDRAAARHAAEAWISYAREHGFEPEGPEALHPDKITWPDGGAPCPLLRVESPGRGTCRVYEDRPLKCRLHYAFGPEACYPDGGQVKMLDTGRAEMAARQHVVHGGGDARNVGLLTVEVLKLLSEEEGSTK